MVWFTHGAQKHARSVVGRCVAGILLSAGSTASAAAQGTAPPITRVTMEQAVRLAIDRNQALQVQRLEIDASKADETTAALKPNPNLSIGATGFTPFHPRQMTFSFLGNDVSYGSTLTYTFERGGKRDKRTLVAQDTTDVTRKNVGDQERQLRFQTEQAFVDTLLAKSTLDLAQQNLKSFSDVVEINRRRVTAGDLAQGDFYRISLQQLQFEQDVSAAQVSLVQARASLRQLLGYEAIADDFDVDGDLAFVQYSLNLDDLKKQALDNRADVIAAHAGVKLAEDSVSLQQSIRTRDIDGDLDYTHTGSDNVLGVGVAFDLPIHDRNQGNIARSEIAVRQAVQTELATRFTAITDVVNAYAAYETNAKVVGLYQSGYLDQARQSLDIGRYVYQRGAGNLLDLLDAERTYRETELGYRQALAAYMTSLRQLNFAVGKQVIP